MSEYKKSCSTCKAEIRMSNNTGPWLPYNLDNSPHKCKNRNEEKARAFVKEVMRGPTLEQRVARLEKIFDNLTKTVYE